MAVRVNIFIILILTLFANCEDWLIDPTQYKAKFHIHDDKSWSISNGLVQRDFVTEPNFGTIDFYSLEADNSLLRALSPESELVFYIDDDVVPVTVGGFTASVPRGYLNRTDLRLDKLSGNVFVYKDHNVSRISSDIVWSPMRGAPESSVWPPAGLHLDVRMKIDNNDVDVGDQLSDVEVHVHYEMYDGVPVISKWVSVSCSQQCDGLRVKMVSVDQLAVNLEWGPRHFGGDDWLQVS